MYTFINNFFTFWLNSNLLYRIWWSFLWECSLLLGKNSAVSAASSTSSLLRCCWTTASCSRDLILLNAANRRLCYSCCFCCSTTVCLRFLTPYSVLLLCVSSPHSRPSILPPSSSSIQNNFFPSLSSVYICAIARQCLHLTSLLFLVPDVLRSCCKPYCRFQLLNLLQFRACCFVFLYSRGHSFWSDERAGGRVASIHFMVVTRQTDLV